MRREIYPQQIYSMRKQTGTQLSGPKLHPWPKYWSEMPHNQKWSFTGRKRQRGDGVDDGDF